VAAGGTGSGGDEPPSISLMAAESAPSVFRSTSEGGAAFDPAKFAKIQTALEKQGVTFVAGEEGRRLAQALGGKLFIGRLR